MFIIAILLSLLKYFVAFCVTAVIGYATYIFHMHRKYDHIPGPPRNSFWFGNLDLVRKSVTEHGIMYPAISQMIRDYGHTIKFFILHTPVVFTVNKEAIKELLAMRKSKKGSNFDLMRNFCGERAMGKSIVLEKDHDKWSWKRSHFNPLFTRGYIGRNYETILNITDGLVSRLAKFADGKTKVSVQGEVKRATLATLAKIYFNVNWNTLTDENSEILHALETYIGGYDELLSDFSFLFNPRKAKKRQQIRNALKYVRGMARSCIEERMTAKKKRETLPDDFVTMLVNLKDEYPEMSTEELVDEFFLLCIAGHETTATSTSFVIKELTNNPKVLKRLRDEIDDNIGLKREFKWNEVDRLPYLEAVIKETLRLDPPATETSRASLKDYNIGGIVIPAGTDIKMSMYISSRLDEAFQNPEAFYPERFMSNDDSSSIVYSYFPFSLGPRSCIGRYLAKVETKVFVVRLLQAFCFEADANSPQGKRQNLVLYPEQGMVVTLTPYNIPK